MAISILPPIPFKSKVLNNLNFFSEAWTKYIVKLDERLKKIGNELILLDVSRDESTDLTAGTGKLSFIMPFAFTLESIMASVSTAPTDADLVLDLNKDGTTILSTKLSIDAGDKTSASSTTSSVISDRNLPENSEITIDIDQIGSTDAGKGLKVYLLGVRV